MQPSLVVFENFSIIAFLRICLIYRSRNFKVVYFVTTKFSEKYLIPALKKLRCEVSQLKFNMIDLRDNRGDLIRLRIFRKDLFELQTAIVGSDLYKTLKHKSWLQDRVTPYIEKGIVDEGIMNPESASRILFLIQVVHWHKEQEIKHPNLSTLFIIKKRPWFFAYKDYAENYGIQLLEAKTWLDKKYNLSIFFKKCTTLYIFLRNIKYFQSFTNKKNNLPKLYLEGRGDVDMENNGYHSDFFWLLNSNFKTKNLLYQVFLKSERRELEVYGINTTSGYAPSITYRNLDFIENLQITRSGMHRQESRQLKSMLVTYNAMRKFWISFFRHNNVKVYMFWHRFNNTHIAISDAIKNVGGVSVYWPISFDGFEGIECCSDTDILFSFSHFSMSLEQKINSRFLYGIITGYPRDYASSLLRGEAQDLRQKMQNSGAKKIIFVIDENSIDDSRWHTGHALQRENYSYIIDKVLTTSWLGVIFKPKAAKTLRSRLNGISEMLAEAENTGRCHIYEDSNRFTTSAPPILAALSSDVCIHAHLSAGTGALECALEGIPTLLIDREGTPNSKLQELPKGKVVFDNWPTAIESVMENFNTPGGIPGFGDWSSIIDDLDPFRDGKAAYRMGEYLSWIIKGFEQGLAREIVMYNAAERYKKEWGEDKVYLQHPPKI